MISWEKEEKADLFHMLITTGRSEEGKTFSTGCNLHPRSTVTRIFFGRIVNNYSEQKKLCGKRVEILTIGMRCSGNIQDPIHTGMKNSEYYFSANEQQIRITTYLPIFWICGKMILVCFKCYTNEWLVKRCMNY